jgi:hypothetical protein
LNPSPNTPYLDNTTKSWIIRSKRPFWEGIGRKFKADAELRLKRSLTFQENNELSNILERVINDPEAAIEYYPYYAKYIGFTPN